MSVQLDRCRKLIEEFSRDGYVASQDDMKKLAQAAEIKIVAGHEPTAEELIAEVDNIIHLRGFDNTISPIENLINSIIEGRRMYLSSPISSDLIFEEGRLDLMILADFIGLKYLPKNADDIWLVKALTIAKRKMRGKTSSSHTRYQISRRLDKLKHLSKQADTIIAEIEIYLEGI